MGLGEGAGIYREKGQVSSIKYPPPQLGPALPNYVALGRHGSYLLPHLPICSKWEFQSLPAPHPQRDTTSSACRVYCSDFVYRLRHPDSMNTDVDTVR